MTDVTTRLTQIVATLQQAREDMKLLVELLDLTRERADCLEAALQEIAHAGPQANPQWMADRAKDALGWERQHRKSSANDEEV